MSDAINKTYRDSLVKGWLKAAMVNGNASPEVLRDVVSLNDKADCATVRAAARKLAAQLNG